jgi:two-component system, OmpR family, copper resistance phosphate regulon response regulator CusR
MAKVLVVEDNAELLDNVREWLCMEDYIVDCCGDGLEAIAYLDSYEYDVVILDWTLPKMSGIEICKQFRGRGGVTPVLMLTGRRTIDDKESGLDAGADDYLTKPFEMRELSARIRALLRRSAQAPAQVLKARSVVLDKQGKRVTKSGVELKLMPKDFSILELLLGNPGRVFSAEAIVERVWSSSADVTGEVIRKHINRIRSQVDDDGEKSLIRTVHGSGYALDP